MAETSDLQSAFRRYLDINGPLFSVFGPQLKFQNDGHPYRPVKHSSGTLGWMAVFSIQF